MKNLYLLTLAMLLSFGALAQNVIITNNVVSVDGQNLFKIVKTKKSNLLLQTMPEFTIYDLQDVPRLKWEGDKGTIVFLDDNKSYLPRTADAYEKSIAKFIVKDSIFTKDGYNAAYKKAWIEKYNGYHHLDKAITYDAKGLAVRDKNQEVKLSEGKIIQDGVIIGTYSSHRSSNTDEHEFRVFNDRSENILRAFYNWSTNMNQGGDFKIVLNLVRTGKKIEHTISGVNNLQPKMVEYLIANGHL